MRYRASTSGIVTSIQGAALIAFVALAIVSVLATIAATVGLLPWLKMSLTFGDLRIPNGGAVIQTSVTVLLALLAFFVPSTMRVQRLEQTHRDFSVCMSDIAEAYNVAHAVDRADVFTISSEFDAVRERINFLRGHPDLGHLEPDVLETAAMMSHTSAELAEIYSDENVARARKFLTERQQEIATFEERIVLAQNTCRELKRWKEQVEIDEDVQLSQLKRLEEELTDILPELGFQRGPKGGKVIKLAAE